MEIYWLWCKKKYETLATKDRERYQKEKEVYNSNKIIHDAEAKFSIKRTSTLEKVFGAWCIQTGDDYGNIIFSNNGNTLNANQQINEADIRDGLYIIEVHYKKVGGTRSYKREFDANNEQTPNSLDAQNRSSTEYSPQNPSITSSTTTISSDSDNSATNNQTYIPPQLNILQPNSPSQLNTVYAKSLDDFLKELKLEKFYQIFKDADVETVKELADLTDENLKELTLTVGARSKINKALGIIK